MCLRGLYYFLFLNLFLLAGSFVLRAQVPQDSTRIIRDTTTPEGVFSGKPADIIDSSGKVIKKGRIPRVAAIRSAVLPGLGQLYNGKVWKVPIVYAALGVTGGIFAYNLKWYNRTRFAYKVLQEEGTGAYLKVDPKLQALVQNNRGETLRYYRDSYRRDIDYSAVFFLIAWGLNVVDASVDAHLSTFDVSPDLSLRIKPGYSEMSGTTGLSLVLNIK